ncbi:MAG TPA: recombination protein RecR, partial [Saprospiraceae bacterium]|nr:recombination protein RecR [Saprospiraceae bacterium]
MTFSSKLIEKAVEAFTALPGIGRKSALRLVLHLLKQDKSATEQLTTALNAMREGIRECSVCRNLA